MASLRRAVVKCGCAQEEITHCAAGVRWLTYLHSLAHETCSTASVGDSSSTTQEHGSAGDDSPEWMVEARQHSSVETWFHELVGKHFRGSLKVCMDPIAAFL